MILRIILFLAINFAALAIGGLSTSAGVSSEWYAELNKAPWTPPGWVFGAAWTTIMICFSLFMAIIWSKESNKKRLILVFSFQWLLNVSWNPIFFYSQNVALGLVIIISLTFIVGYFLLNYSRKMKLNFLLILPYFIWLIIATSLNAYIFVMN